MKLSLHKMNLLVFEKNIPFIFANFNPFHPFLILSIWREENGAFPSRNYDKNHVFLSACGVVKSIVRSQPDAKMHFD